MKHQYILLKGLNAHDIDIKYSLQSNILTEVSSNRTNISELQTVVQESKKYTVLEEPKKHTIGNLVLLDEAKKEHNYILSMKNLLDEWIPTNTDIHCFWCRHPFDTIPIGCPIQYIPQRLEKKIPCDHKDDVIIRENISLHTFKKINTDLNKSFINQDCYFRVDGIFCSFPCCMAFIQEVEFDPLYQNSESLLRLMHKQCFPNSTQILSPAPSWRLLSSYGGSLDITQFRESFVNTDYINHHQHMIHVPMQKMSGFLYESQIKL
jgi:hypothetical protein